MSDGAGSSSGDMSYSIVIPAYNEAKSLRELCSEIAQVMETVSGDYEILVVDDGSSDDTASLLASLHREDDRVCGLRFARNFGKSAAYLAGFEFARGDLVITLDADLQDDPKEIPKLLETLEQGYDLVVGWKQSRMGNEPDKALASRVFNGVLQLLFGLKLHDSNSGFRVMRSEVARSLDLYGDVYRFIPEIVHLSGYRVTEAPVQHRTRKHGASKYGPTRFLTGLLDLLAVRFITAFKQKPLQFFGSLAIPPLVAGVGLELYVLAMRLLYDSSLRIHVAAIIIGTLLILASLQLFATGLLGEMLAEGSRRRTYVIGETIGDVRVR
jgi:glycosyltransferase involved in cell wall biosynthesis